MQHVIDGISIMIGSGGRPIDQQRRAIVFVHGAGMDHTAWVAQARSYAEAGWSVIAPDLPGHGHSGGTPLARIEDMAHWVFEVLDVLGFERAAMVGHSMGGAIVLEAAAVAPERVTHLGIVGSGAAIRVNPALIETAEKEPAKAYDMMTKWALAPAARIGSSAVPGLWLAGSARAVFDQNRPGVLASDLRACAAWTNGAEAAKRVACSAVVIAGERDIMTPPKRSQELAGLIEGAKLVTLQRIGHMIMAEAPYDCTRALRSVII